MFFPHQESGFQQDEDDMKECLVGSELLMHIVLTNSFGAGCAATAAVVLTIIGSEG